MPTQIKHKIGSGAPLASDLIEGELGLDTVNGRAYTENSVGSIVELGTNPAAEIQANAGIALPDSQKATFGASDDLQIYHDGSHSYINDTGTGDLFIKGDNNLWLRSAADENYIRCDTDGAVWLYYDNVNKLTTTSTGIDVTGTVTADGLTVAKGSEGTYATISGDNASGGRGLAFTSSTNNLSVGAKHTIDALSGNGAIEFATGSTTRALIDYTGDISFYEDTGTTAKFFWDASAESLGIGTSSPAQRLHLSSTGNTFARIDGGATSTTGVLFDSGDGAIYYDASSNFMRLDTLGTEAARIDSSGNLLVGTTDAAVGVGNTNTGSAFGGSTGYGCFSRTGAAAQATLYVNKNTNDGTIVDFRKDGTTVGSIGCASSGTDIYFGTDTAAGIRCSGAAVYPATAGSGADNTYNLGASAVRWATVYAATALINTSDEREKTPLEDLDAAELAVAKELKAAIKKFKFKDAVEAKGEAARLHVGVGAQTVKAIFESHGLVAEDYAILCYDEWDAEFDEDGNETRPAGSRYGVRYEELLAFIIAAI